MIKLEGNEYVVYNGDGNDADPLEFFDRSILGDEVAKKMANTYLKGYDAGYSQAKCDAE